jgi:hypothetical protein
MFPRRDDLLLDPNTVFQPSRFGFRSAILLVGGTISPCPSENDHRKTNVLTILQPKDLRDDPPPPISLDGQYGNPLAVHQILQDQGRLTSPDLIPLRRIDASHSDAHLIASIDPNADRISVMDERNDTDRDPQAMGAFDDNEQANERQERAKHRITSSRFLPLGWHLSHDHA